MGKSFTLYLIHVRNTHWQYSVRCYKNKTLFRLRRCTKKRNFCLVRDVLSCVTLLRYYGVIVITDSKLNQDCVDDRITERDGQNGIYNKSKYTGNEAY